MKFQRKCRFCGAEFETTSATKIYCDNPHFDSCVICGKSYSVPKSALSDPERARTCSVECRVKLRKQTNLSKYGVESPIQNSEIRKKIENTNLERYGTKHPVQTQECKEKTKQTNQRKYGKDYFTQTSDWKDSITKSNIQKYGVSWATQSEQVKSKISKTNLDRYGVECVLSDKNIRDKARDTYKSKTGYSEPFANPDVVGKVEDTNLQRYGVRRPLQNKQIYEKSVETVRSRFGVINPLQNESVKQKVKDTCIKRYGTTTYLTSEEGKTRTKSSMLNKYGTINYAETPEWVKSVMDNPDKYEEYVKFHSDPTQYVSALNKPSIKQLAEAIGVSDPTAGEYIREYHLEDYVRYTFSYAEIEIFNAINQIVPDTEIILNSKQIIPPYEVDIYLPEYKLGIEINPTTTHNSTVGIYRHDPKPHNYHRMKSDLCYKEGIFLFHIFGWEWSHKQDIIISMLRNLLGKNTNRIYARNTYVKSLSTIECEKFLDVNHRQGKVRCPIRLGLFENKSNRLVSVMTFSNIRSTIGKGKSEDTNSYELVRFCNLLNTSVIGGASKLYKYFLNNYKPNIVKSYSDIAHTRGNLYKQLGFTKAKVNKPGYVWVNLKTDVAVSRLNAQKRNIKKYFKDDTIDTKNQTEVEIMTKWGYVQVFDSGTILWEHKLPCINIE